MPRGGPSYGQVKVVHVHHTVSLNDYTPAEAPAVVLAICRYHRNSNGWDDIGYNALVDRYGTIYEGRAGGLDQAIVGAHAQGFNSQTAGVANIGDYSSVGASPEALSATADYVRWKLGVHGQPLSGPVTVRSSGGPASRYSAGANVTLERVIGHRDTGRTACPGDALYDQLPEIREIVESGAPFAPSVAARVTAALADTRVDYGEVVPVNGVLLGPDGAPLGDQTVELQVNTENRWRRARRVTTGSDGAFLTDLKPAKRMYVRVRYPGRGEIRGTASQRLLLSLRPVLGFDRAPKRGRRGRSVSGERERWHRGSESSIWCCSSGSAGAGARWARERYERAGPLQHQLHACLPRGLPLLRRRQERPRHGSRHLGDPVPARALSRRLTNPA